MKLSRKKISVNIEVRLKRDIERQTNIVDDFLNHNEPEEEDDDDSCGFASETKFKRECHEHRSLINNIEAEKFIPLKNVMIKYKKQTDSQSYQKNYSYSRITPNMWYLRLGSFEDIIEVKNNGNIDGSVEKKN